MAPGAQSGMGKWIALFVVVLAASLAAVLGIRPLAYSQGWLTNGGQSSLSPSALETYRVPTPTPSPITTEPARVPTAEGLGAALRAVTADTDADLTAWVADLRTGEVLFEQGAWTPVVPASGIKVLTATALLASVASDQSVTTSVVLNDAGLVVLVGGGDPSLRSEPDPAAYPAAVSTRALAQQTADALRAKGVTSVSVGFDDDLFVGPSWHPAWPMADELYVGDVSALMVNGGSLGEAGFSHTPAEDAARVFAGQLREAGITVDAEVGRVDGQGATLASAESPTMSVLVIDALLRSDNTATEVLARHLAIAVGQPASFDGVSAAMRSTLERLGLPVDGTVFADASGMASTNRVTAGLLGQTIVKDANHVTLSRIVDGLPVGGASGTLRSRYGRDDARAGRGWVHAKTGTLAGVGSLTGYAQTADGALIAFSFVLNDGSDAGLRPYLDRLTATIAACGC